MEDSKMNSIQYIENCEYCHNNVKDLLILFTDEIGKGIYCRACSVVTRIREGLCDENKVRFISLCSQGKHALRQYEFGKASSIYKEALNLYPDASDALWGKICATYGIV